MFHRPNDPLLNSVKAVMDVNSKRRILEQKLQEELGIESRRELPNELQESYDALLVEKWSAENVVDPSKKGMFKGMGKDELKAKLSSLKKSGPHKENSPDATKEKELAFAIRAKSNWGKVNESYLEEERKRTQAVSDAFLSGKKAKMGPLETDGQKMSFHGNTIAKHSGDEVHLTTAGYGTSPSTRGHVNGVLSRLGAPSLSQKKGKLMHGDKEISSSAWIKVKKPSPMAEENLEEVSTKTLGGYMKKAGNEYMDGARGKKEISDKKLANRMTGISKASNKVWKKKIENKLDEAKVGDVVKYKGVDHRVIHVHGEKSKSPITGKEENIKGHLNIVPVQHGRSREWPKTVSPSEISEGSVETTMKEFEKGKLHSGSKTGPVVHDRKQAIAIALSQKDKLNESNLVMEEIKSKLEARLIEAYDNNTIDAFVATLSEGEKVILNLQEANSSVFDPLMAIGQSLFGGSSGTTVDGANGSTKQSTGATNVSATPANPTPAAKPQSVMGSSDNIGTGSQGQGAITQSAPNSATVRSDKETTASTTATPTIATKPTNITSQPAPTPAAPAAPKPAMKTSGRSAPLRPNYGTRPASMTPGEITRNALGNVFESTAPAAKPNRQSLESFLRKKYENS